MELPGHGGEVNRASDVSCMACHGAAYEKIYRNWKEGSERRTAALAGQLDATARALGAGVGTRLADARHNLALVRRAHGIHNVPYAYALLRKSHEDMNAARRERGLSPLPRPGRSRPSRVSQVRGSKSGAARSSAGATSRSMSSNRRSIPALHRTHEEKPEAGVRFDASGCESCHHRTPTCAARRPATRTSAKDRRELPRQVQPFGASTTEIACGRATCRPPGAPESARRAWSATTGARSGPAPG
jgi:hypothetical protein